MDMLYTGRGGNMPVFINIFVLIETVPNAGESGKFFPLKRGDIHGNNH